MKYLIYILLSVLAVSADAGICEYPEDRASDGTRCGKRSSWER
jgi:hypothetical protein